MPTYHLGADGLPLLEAALAWVVCELDRTIEAGDHTIYLGRVLELGASDGDRGRCSTSAAATCASSAPRPPSCSASRT